jgi:hypothetical protein
VGRRIRTRKASAEARMNVDSEREFSAPDGSLRG